MNLAKLSKTFLLFPVTLFASEPKIVSLDWTQASEKEYKNVTEVYNASEKLTNQNQNRRKNSALLEKFPNLQIYKIKDGCEIIPKQAFAGFYWNGEIVVPPSVKEIQQYAFAHQCYVGYHIPKVKIPVSVKQIAQDAFYRKKGFDEKEGDHRRKSPDITIYGVKTFEELSNFATVLGEACQFVTHVAFDPGFNENTVNQGIFQKFKNLQELTLPETTTTIGNKAFQGVRLTKITLPSQLKSIGEAAFSQTRLKSISIPDSVTIIGKDAFKNCYSLEGVHLSKNLETIDEGTFSKCQNLNNCSIVIPPSVKEIKEKAFVFDQKDCQWRKFRIHPETKISNDAFNKNDCFELDCSNSEKSWDEIKQNLSPIISKIDALVLPNTIKTITKDMLSDFTGLVSLTLPTSVTKIEDDALSAPKLNSLTLPASIQNIGQNDGYLKWLQFFEISDCENFDPEALNRLREVLGESAKYVTKLPTVTTSTIEITQDTFKGFEGLTEIIIPDGVAKIGNAAFKNFKMLSSVKLPDSVQIIDEEAFSKCTALHSINFNDGLAEIGQKAFSHTGLCSVCLPKTVKKVGSQAFADCKKLYSVAKIPASIESLDNPFTDGTIKIEISGKPDSLENLAEKLGPLCQNVISLTCPDGIQIITRDTFKAFHKQHQKTGSYIDDGNSSNLQKIVLPDTVTEIGDRAFSNFKELKEINIPNSVTKIGDNAFADTHLDTIVLPDSIQSLGKGAFSGSDLSKVTLPAIPLAIPQECFKNCSGLTKINNNSETFNLPEGITEIGSHAFSGCGNNTNYWRSKLRKIVIPSTCTTIQSYAFQDCSNLSTVEFAERNNRELRIQPYAFTNTKIHEIQLPNGVICADDSFPNSTNIKRPDQPKEQVPQPSVIVKEEIPINDDSIKNSSENQNPSDISTSPQTPAGTISKNNEDLTENQAEDPSVDIPSQQKIKAPSDNLMPPPIQQHGEPSLTPLAVDASSSFSTILKWTGITVITGICIYGAKKIYNYLIRHYFQKI